MTDVEEHRFYVNAASVDITPEKPTPLSASRAGKILSERVADPVESNLLRLSVPQGPSMLMVSVDALSCGVALRQAILRACPGLEDASLLLAASHSHSSPALDADLASLGAPDPAHAAWATNRIAKAAARIWSAPGAPAALRYGATTGDCCVNRRRTVWRLNRMRGFRPERASIHLPNPDGPKNETVHALALTDAQGSPVAIIWSYACHPVCFPDPRVISAEYVGVVRAALRAAHGDIPALFLQGFCGDVRPEAHNVAPTLKHKIQRLLYGRIFGPYDAERFAHWSGRIAEAALAAAHGARTAPAMKARMNLAHERLPIGALQDQPVSRPDIHLQRIEIGDALVMHACSAEAPTNYGPLLSEPDRICVPVGYTDHVYGYMPDDAIQAEGGYEADGFRPNFDLEGRYLPGVQAKVVDRFDALRQAARAREEQET